MRNRFLLGAGVALAVALSWADAQAQLLVPPSGPGSWYFGGQVGWTMLDSERGSLGRTAGGSITVRENWNDGFNTGVRGGYEWGPWRFEEEFSFQTNGLHSLGLSAASPGWPAGTSTLVGGDRNAYAFMTNAIYDFAVGWPVTPHGAESSRAAMTTRSGHEACLPSFSSSAGIWDELRGRRRTRDCGGRGVAAMLLDAAEAAALAHDCRSIRLEVHETNHAAISRYRKSGYREFGRHRRYYEDGGDALRFEKPLGMAAPSPAPPYFHQTTEFTCGPACMMMALAWAESRCNRRTDRSFQPAPAFEFKLWREATTIFTGPGAGGCEPYGIAVALKRRGLIPEIYVSRPGPYFLDTVRSADKRRVMALTQADFQREAKALAIASHLTPASESVLMRAFEAGHVAIVLVSGYHMVPRGKPHWIFAFGRDGRHVLMHDPAAIRDDQGMAAAAETYAVPWTAFERVTHLGRERLSAAIVIRKGPS